jgi:hypothetical protein
MALVNPARGTAGSAARRKGWKCGLQPVADRAPVVEPCYARRRDTTLYRRPSPFAWW